MNGIIHIPTSTFHNKLLSSKYLLNYTTNSYSWKKSNSIEILKKLIANRQNLTKYNLKLLLTNNTQQQIALPSSKTFLIQVKPIVNISNTTLNFQIITFKNTSNTYIQYSSTINPSLLLFPSIKQKLDKKESSNTTIFAIIFVCSFSGLVFLAFICTFFLRQPIKSAYAYFQLPCIHTLSTTKRSRDSTPLSYSPIHISHNKYMGSHQSSFIKPTLANISINSYNRDRRNRSSSKSITTCCSPTKIRRQTNNNLLNNDHKEFTIPKEFPIDQLYDIYMQKHALDDLAFSIEFQSIPNFEELPCTSATRTIVASKNRFLNILPIDTTRVILNLLNDDPATDYINGNYISGYKCSNKFIATQGPKFDTCEDFWRMIWELKLKSIVMLTNIIEGASRMLKR
ncbi:unnamed protein product [Rotaria sp. Silwood1]|nr:unnamed protein product [Rotaria sp. Silwood1]